MATAALDLTEMRRRLPADGSAPPPEAHAAFAEHYGLSRNTVRRAIAVLAEEGLIRTRPGWGTFVVPENERRARCTGPPC